MKKTAFSLLLTALALCIGTVSLSGCEEEAADTATMRRARLVADENIQLKKQLADKDKEIERHKQLLEECKQEMAKAQEDAGNTMLQMLQRLAETSKDVETLTEENTRLKEKLAELEAQRTSNAAP